MEKNQSENHTNNFTPRLIDHRFTAIVISDDTITMAMIKAAFNKDQFEVHHAKDAETAVRKLTLLKNIDMVLLSPLKGEKNCIELTRIVREKLDNSKTPILALAGDMPLHDQMLLKQAGANAWVTKPYTLEQFDQLINFVLF